MNNPHPRLNKTAIKWEVSVLQSVVLTWLLQLHLWPQEDCAVFNPYGFLARSHSVVKPHTTVLSYTLRWFKAHFCTAVMLLALSAGMVPFGPGRFSCEVLYARLQGRQGNKPRLAQHRCIRCVL